jgi:2-polyprenyl-3-methyl-5-hydroxy-6-metoxy-1,4-benzoquinol methylase
MTPDWQLPAGVDRGLHDYLRSSEMVAGYDDMMSISPLAGYDVEFCKTHFTTPGKVIDLGCGTGRLAKHFSTNGFSYTGVDLSEEMLAVAQQQPGTYLQRNLVDDSPVPGAPYDYAACLFSTLGMVRGVTERRQVLRNIHALLRPGGLLVLHAHNRYFMELGLRGWRNGDITQPQAYGGALLTLHHFSRGELQKELRAAGFAIRVCQPVGLSGKLNQSWWCPMLRAYGYLVCSGTATAGSGC